MTNGDNLDAVIRAANTLSIKNKKTYFVVFEPDHTGDYHVASEFDLDTWFAGISDNHIMYCTEA
jgi:hypothetical protein